MRKDTKQHIELKRGPFVGRGALLAFLSALAAGAALLAAIILTACSGSLATALRPDGSATLSIQAEIPAPLAARFRTLSGGGRKDAKPLPLFDEGAIRESVANRPYLAISSLSVPNPDSLRAEIAIKRVSDLAQAEEIKKSGLVSLTSGPGWTELRIRLERGRASASIALFPGIDPYLIDALSPPALEDEPLSADEYRMNLKTILASAMPAMEAAVLTVSLAAPGQVLSSGGGSLAGNVLTAKIPIIDALVLEKPIEFWIR
ncbi:MAG: hypothetical protein Q8M76_03200, partial [Spirochaetaceae bacterium]|nr:hypothetical protein [Spirochaetaceae bacterium]